ncbi:ATP-binding cassette domain-containing protein, partial [Burkholderia sp. SIMBA_019]|uniref:ATP-binding cassette domain-containing protein n=1 Tax=Burkholderia sp. SIMBA_019 TaxID=3085765 RepID=UPI00397960A2
MAGAEQHRLFTEDHVTVAPVITVRGLRTAFGDHVVHDNLDLTVFPGEILVLVGGSGTGKTVLLRQIIGLDQPAAGTIQ